MMRIDHGFFDYVTKGSEIVLQGNGVVISE